jgi:membrane protein DedA with SNARE-associated domain
MKVAVIAPVVEESIFRGVIMSGFMRNYPKYLAIFFSALLFALFHLNPWQFPATFVLGLLLGWLMVRTRNIFACIAGHSINNLLVLLSMTFAQEISQSRIMSMGERDKIVLAALAIVVSIFIMYWLTRKRNRKSAGISNPGTQSA